MWEKEMLTPGQGKKLVEHKAREEDKVFSNCGEKDPEGIRTDYLDIIF